MLRAYECNVKGTDWQREIFAMSPGKAKSEYWRGVNESWNTIPYTAITCRCTGKPHNTLSFQRTAKYRGVPFATIGMNVTVDGEPGIIVGSNDSANFNVLFTGGKFKGQTLNCHPNWKMRYFTGEGYMSEKLKPCPFCGEKKDLEFEKDSFGNWTVECAVCGAIGPWARGKKRASELWDERVVEGE